MSDTVTLPIEEAYALCVDILDANGFSTDHSAAIARLLCRCQEDECQSHGLFRLLMCVNTRRAGKMLPDIDPEISQPTDGIVRVDAKGGAAPLSFAVGRPVLVEKARRHGIAAMAINNCYHFSALWPEVEDLAADGVAALCMLPSYKVVAPSGGTKPVFGTNPIAFAWPRPGGVPYVFDFATSAVARGEIDLHRRADKPIPQGWAIDSAGQPTTDAVAALAGSMLTFGGYKGSALSTMIELLAGPLIGDLLSLDAPIQAGGPDLAPCHGELVIAFDPRILGGGEAEQHAQRAEALFAALTDQGARLPSQRRREARARTAETGAVTISRQLYADIVALRPS